MTHRWITTKVLWITAFATALTFIMVLGTLIVTAHFSNRQAALRSVAMVAGGLQSMADQMRQIGAVYPAGPQEQQLLIIQKSTPDELLTVDQANNVPDALKSQVSNAFRRDSSADFVVFYAMLGGTVHQISADRKRAGIILAQPLDNATVRTLGATFLLGDLQTTQTPQTSQSRQPLTDANGANTHYLVWSPVQPGAATIDLFFVPLSGFLALYLVLAIAILRVTRGNAKALDAREAETTLIARRDSLTDLPNRTAFGEHLTEIMFASQQEVTVVVMDINGFKRINDSAGHAVGDEVIAVLSLRLQDAMPGHGFLARVGGDEFRAIFNGFAASEARDQFLEELSRVQAKPICIDDRPFQIAMAVGYATGFPQDTSATEITRFADLAMYEAKNRMIATPFAYHDGIESDQSQRQKIEDVLRAALATGEEFEVQYQPIICASSGKMVMAEALTRWKSSELGRMSPDRFIPIAESSGLIVPLGKSLLNQVCSDLRAWSGLQASVNLSPAQLRDPNFMQETAQIIKRHGIQPSRIEFELTEGIFVDDPTLAATKLAQLREMGHRISLDDFGTGFSSIGYLRKIKFDKLKIDKTFIDDIGTTPTAKDLLRSLALLAKSFDLQIVAEGVEHEAQYEALYDLGYDFIQGFYCGKAMPFDDLFSIFTGQLSKTKPNEHDLAKAS